MKYDKNYKLPQVFRFSMIEHKTPTYTVHGNSLELLITYQGLQPLLFALHVQKERFNTKGANF